MTTHSNASGSDENPQRFSSSPREEGYDGIDFRIFWHRLVRSLPQIVGLALLGAAVAAACLLVGTPFRVLSTSTRITFSFDGYERGEYPDHSKFQSDDLRSPGGISEALKRLQLDASESRQGAIRSALSIEGIIPPNIVKERDRRRANGLAAAPLVPDEYAVTLQLPRDFPLTVRQRELLLGEIVNVYREQFIKTYADLPLGYGSAFETLRNMDYFEYELLLDKEIQNLTAYLSKQAEAAKFFRSSSTNLSFGDLLRQTQLFAQLRLNETLGLIHQNGLSRNRSVAMVKMNYYLRTLEDQERRATEEEKVLQELLSKTQERTQNYVLGIKSQAAQPKSEAPLIDQGLIDSLLANDSYNFLIRKALDAGLKVKQVQADKAELMERRKNMESFMRENAADQSTLITQVQTSITELEKAYYELINRIRQSNADFTRQQFADAIRITDATKTDGGVKLFINVAAIGFILGAAMGAGLGLIEVRLGRKNG